MNEFNIPTFDHEGYERRHQEKLADNKRRSAADLFNPVNLGHWISLCQESGVPFVPAIEIARAPVDDLTQFDASPPPAACVEFMNNVSAEMRFRGENWMVRWSCCSCAEVKQRLGSGQPEWHKDLVDYFMIGDLRAFDLICEYPEETIAAYARPWVKAAILDSYPVEYRVFVDHNQIAGISNYYPQRALPNDRQTLLDVAVCFKHSAALLRAQTKPLNCPQMEKFWDMKQNHWTADFIRTEDGEILFLEGGPPHTPNGGAHMCCFPVGQTDGIALAATHESLALMGITSQSTEKEKAA